MATRLFLLVTDVATNKLVLVGLAHVKTIEPDAKGKAVIDLNEQGIHCKESFEEVVSALSGMMMREGAAG